MVKNALTSFFSKKISSVFIFSRRKSLRSSFFLQKKSTPFSLKGYRKFKKQFKNRCLKSTPRYFLSLLVGNRWLVLRYPIEPYRKTTKTSTTSTTTGSRTRTTTKRQRLMIFELQIYSHRLLYTNEVRPSHKLEMKWESHIFLLRFPTWYFVSYPQAAFNTRFQQQVL